MDLDEFQQAFHKLERRVRDSRVVEVLGNAELCASTKKPISASGPISTCSPRNCARRESWLKFDTDEEHSAFFAMFHDSTNAERRIGASIWRTSLEYRKYRLLAKDIAKFNKPPFTVFKNDNRDMQNNWRDLLDHVKAEGKRDASVQRYKGLGEMNAEQLADTTMNPEKRTLLVVRLEDLVATDQIFTTLMGEDVESRRKFIEDNALDVKNLDVLRRRPTETALLKPTP